MSCSMIGILFNGDNRMGRASDDLELVNIGYFIAPAVVIHSNGNSWPTQLFQYDVTGVIGQYLDTEKTRKKEKRYHGVITGAIHELVTARCWLTGKAIPR